MPETGRAQGALPTFGLDSKIRDVVSRLGERGGELLRQHGYDVGEGFVDVLSQYQTLEHASRQERLRDVNGLLAELNSLRGA
ncbi:hypothetical protein EPN29_11410 [bacterium]|nr:MAG: hypothetical protein EPN29_11410 [bacterium]